jgi:hypothetical protein
MGKRPELVGSRISSRSSNVVIPPDHRVLGSDPFIEKLRNCHGFRERLSHPQRLSLNELRSKVTAVFELPTDAIMRRRRGNSAAEARGLFCCLAVNALGYSGVAVGRYLQVDGSSVSRAVIRGDEYLRKNLDRVAIENLLNH